MTSSYRLADIGRVDRSKPVSFWFNGKKYEGFEGDTLASALMANGVHFIGRSFKYHRPRGIMAAGAEDPGGLVQLEEGAHTIPNLRATQVELYDGMQATSVNVWPSLEFDISAVNGFFSKIMTAGFYNKTFMWPRSFWESLYEPVIRRAAGWGKSPTETDPDIYDHMHDYPDVLIVGGGAAGLAAALEAAASGARIVLVDENPELGGSLLYSDKTIDGLSASDWAQQANEKLASYDNVRILSRTVLFGYYDHNYLVAVEQKTDHLALTKRKGKVRQRTWHFRAKKVILATGAHERPLLFPDNDRPGIMLSGSVVAYALRYGAKPGDKILIAGNNNSIYEHALSLNKAGVNVVAVVDTRKDLDSSVSQPLSDAGISIHCGYHITKTKGTTRVKGVTITEYDQGANAYRSSSLDIDCDVIGMSGGWSPVVHLFSQSQGQLAYDEEKLCYKPDISRQAQLLAGGIQGTFSISGSIKEGQNAAQAALKDLNFDLKASDDVSVDGEIAWGIEENWSHVPEHLAAKKSFIDFQNDTSVSDILLATREGFESPEHVKRYTLTGFGTDQGKTSNINALGVLSQVLGEPSSNIATTTFRAPYTPITYGALAGRHIGDHSDPIRTTAIHDWHKKAGAEFENVGQWLRPWYYPVDGETMDEATRRECRAVRTSVGVLDASTLGKIDVVGPDAAEFLNRIYTNAWLKLGVGRIRYGLMCHEDGMVFDDGTTSRLSENHFFMTTTTGGAAGVLDWLEDYLQTEWPDLDVYCTSSTEQWATVAVAGPKARFVVQQLFPDMDLSPESFPFMSFKEADYKGNTARVSRISFTGELSFEINTPWHLGKVLWEEVMEAGAEFDITPYGTETMHILRAEKGFIIVGQETDGTTTPQDLDMDWIVSKKKPDFIGKRSYTRADTSRDDRKQLVGLLTKNKNDFLPEGAQLVFDQFAAKPMPMVGHVTSSYYSDALGRNISLALVKGGINRKGDIIYAPLEQTTIAAEIVSPVFYDPEGKVQDGDV